MKTANKHRKHETHVKQLTKTKNKNKYNNSETNIKQQTTKNNKQQKQTIKNI